MKMPPKENFCVLDKSEIVSVCDAGDDQKQQEQCAYYSKHSELNHCRHFYGNGTNHCDSVPAKKLRAADDVEQRARTNEGMKTVFDLLFQSKDLISDYMSQEVAPQNVSCELMKRGVRINAAIGLILKNGVKGVPV